MDMIDDEGQVFVIVGTGGHSLHSFTEYSTFMASHHLGYGFLYTPNLLFIFLKGAVFQAVLGKQSCCFFFFNILYRWQGCSRQTTFATYFFKNG